MSFTFQESKPECRKLWFSQYTIDKVKLKSSIVPVLIKPVHNDHNTPEIINITNLSKGERERDLSSRSPHEQNKNLKGLGKQ